MVTDPHLVKRLNLLRTQPEWVYREVDDGSMKVLKPAVIPADQGFFWVAGITVTASGAEIPSVFVIDTDAGAEQYQVYWFVDGTYYEHRDAEQLATVLGIKKTNFFPYSWRYHVPVEEDVHSASRWLAA